MEKRKVISQGDVNFIPVEYFPKEFVEQFTKEKKGNVLAEGEMTGHFHRVIGEDFKILTKAEIAQQVNMMLVRIGKEASIEHEEHESFPITGDYIAVIQQEIDPFEGILRTVAD